jgi:hypothetical protein
MSSCETHAADTFVLREPLRSLRAFTLLDLWHLADKDGLYQGTAGAGKLDPLNTEAVTQSAQKIAYIATDLAKHTPNLHFYYAIIPDKSTYDGHQAVGFNVEQAELLLAPTLPHLTGLSLTDALEANDFYRTDLHWDQSALVREHGVLEALQEGMGFSTPAYPGYEYREAGSFEGVYPGQLALPFAPDVMSYLTNPTIEGLSARYLDLASDRLVAGPIYDLEAFAARDPYDLFCRGAQPLVVFENPEASGERELYVFRDSYGSSLGPLLAQGYSRVTLIDLRYVDYRVLERYVSFAPGSDVLFCYSSQILNNPTVLLVQ